jgi:hypothetical protein
MARKGDFLKVENATSAFLATCLLLLATALGQVWRCRAFPHLCGVFLSLFAARGNRKTEREKNAKHRNNLTLVQTDPQKMHTTRQTRGTKEDHNHTQQNTTGNQ